MRSCSDVSPTAPASWPSKRSAYKAWPSLWKERRGCEPRAHSIEVSAETVTGTLSSGVVSLVVEAVESATLAASRGRTAAGRRRMALSGSTARPERAAQPGPGKGSPRKPRAASCVALRRHLLQHGCARSRELTAQRTVDDRGGCAADGLRRDQVARRCALTREGVHLDVAWMDARWMHRVAAGCLGCSLAASITYVAAS